MYWCDSQQNQGLRRPIVSDLEGNGEKLWQSCTIEHDIAVWRFRHLAQMGGKEANTLHTLSGFPGLGM
jgi:hypothetical protein